jgi:hypothetical protein
MTAMDVSFARQKVFKVSTGSKQLDLLVGGMFSRLYRSLNSEAILTRNTRWYTKYVHYRRYKRKHALKIILSCVNEND